MKYRRSRGYLFIFIIGVVLYSCRKSYNPPAIITSSNYLVVESHVINGPDSTIVKLSRTVKLASQTTLNPEKNAVVVIESDLGASYQLNETKPGSYSIAGLNLDETHKYRLSIKTTNGHQYQSDFVQVLDSPPIDSLSFDSNGDLASGPGMKVYVNTHDASNKVRYFRWDYSETWEFHSAFQSKYYSNGDTVLHRNFVNDDIYFCWRSDSSSSIVLGNTARLSQSVVFQQPVAFVTSSSEKVSVEYSILVHQYALTADAYNFYSALKKNTELLGSIFDAQPSELQSNIHCINNPQEPVIGYLSIGATTSKRLFVRVSQLPVWTPVTYYTTSYCTIANDPNDPQLACCYYSFVDQYGLLENQVDKYINYNIGHYSPPFIPIDALGPPERPPIGFTASTQNCVDCTLRGTNTPPAFWK